MRQTGAQSSPDHLERIAQGHGGQNLDGLRNDRASERRRRWSTRPHTRWLFASYAHHLSLRDSLHFRDVIQSAWYQRHWGRRFRLREDQNQKTRFHNDRSGFRLASSTGGVGTGEGGDFIVADDPHNVTEAESDAQRDAVLRWWDQSMSTRGNDPRTVVHVVVMQRVHERDLSGHLLEQGGYEHLCLPMEFEPEAAQKAGKPKPRSKQRSYGHPPGVWSRVDSTLAQVTQLRGLDRSAPLQLVADGL